MITFVNWIHCHSGLLLKVSWWKWMGRGALNVRRFRRLSRPRVGRLPLHEKQSCEFSCNTADKTEPGALAEREGFELEAFSGRPSPLPKSRAQPRDPKNGAERGIRIYSKT